MRGDREFEGMLLGFDDFVNMVLEDAIELCVHAEDSKTAADNLILRRQSSEDGKIRKNIGQILLNGNNVCMVSNCVARDLSQPLCTGSPILCQACPLYRSNCLDVRIKCTNTCPNHASIACEFHGRTLVRSQSAIVHREK